MMRITMTTTITIAAKTPGLSFLPFFLPFFVVLALDLLLVDLAASPATAEEVELTFVVMATAEVLRVVGAYCDILVNGHVNVIGGTNRCDGCSRSYLCIYSFIADSETFIGVGVVCENARSSKPDG